MMSFFLWIMMFFVEEGNGNAGRGEGGEKIWPNRKGASVIAESRARQKILVCTQLCDLRTLR
jgi:hypothetical protein